MLQCLDYNLKFESHQDHLNVFSFVSIECAVMIDFNDLKL